MDTFKEREIKEIFNSLAAVMNEKKDWLIELDGAMGDGDLGITMCIGFSKAAEALNSFNEKDVGKLLAKAGMVFAQAAPSTMGTLLATGLIKGGKAVQGREELALADFTEMLAAFVEGIMARGKAQPGEKTILDSLYPSAQALKSAVESGGTLKDSLGSAYEAAVNGVEESKKLMATHGRAAYYQEKSVGMQDPGATVGMLFIKAFADYAR